MPFESLSEKIQFSLRKLTGRGKVNEKTLKIPCAKLEFPYLRLMSIIK